MDEDAKNASFRWLMDHRLAPVGGGAMELCWRAESAEQSGKTPLQQMDEDIERCEASERRSMSIRAKMID